MKTACSHYTNYFNDNFGLRNALLRLNSIIKYDLLGVSPNPQVIIGKNGWLFYNAEREIEDYRALTQYDAATILAWAKTLEMKRIWLKSQGVQYFFVVAPNKSTIYSEFLPDEYTKVRKKTFIDELVECVEKNTGVTIIDLRPVLLAAKSKELLYLRTDTHWNEYGAVHPLKLWDGSEKNGQNFLRS
jgi:alginate O-acetyltransferase complex protein AlgJ